MTGRGGDRETGDFLGLPRLFEPRNDTATLCHCERRRFLRFARNKSEQSQCVALIHGIATSFHSINNSE